LAYVFYLLVAVVGRKNDGTYKPLRDLRCRRDAVVGRKNDGIYKREKNNAELAAGCRSPQK